MSVNSIYNGGYQTTGSVSIAGGGAGSVLTSNGAGITGTTWASPNTHFNSTNGKAVMTIPHGEDKVIVEENAALEVKGSIKLNGECLNERLERIETVLNIPTRDITMEHKYPKLKELWAEYNRELSKYKTWDNLKGTE